MTVLISLIASCAIFATLCGLVTNAKGRGWIGVALGGVLGFVGGPIGGLIAVGFCALIRREPTTH